MSVMMIMGTMKLAQLPVFEHQSNERAKFVVLLRVYLSLSVTFVLFSEQPSIPD
jgi:hypothetical protein